MNTSSSPDDDHDHDHSHGHGHGHGPGADADARRVRRLTWLLAVTSAVTAANVYLSQPLLGPWPTRWGLPGLIGAVPTATQLGYAAGILLLVPAGDSHDRRRLILVLGAASAGALAACAVAPTVWWLIVASFAVGLLSPVPQLVTPLAVALAGAREGPAGGSWAPCRAGCWWGARLPRLLGAFAELVGWRAVHLCSGALTLTLVLVLRRVLPSVPRPGPPATAPRWRRCRGSPRTRWSGWSWVPGRWSGSRSARSGRP
ncbi:MFS transporter [Streptomyces sp. M19]